MEFEQDGEGGALTRALIDHGWSYERKAGKGHAHLIMSFTSGEGKAVRVRK